MIRFAIRRLLWSMLSFVVLSVAVFVLTNLVSNPDEGKLPWFINTSPEDVTSRTEAALALLSREETRAQGEARLSALGGAALPLLLPRFDELSTESRARLSTALGPVLVRTGQRESGVSDMRDIDPIFWIHFWEEHAVDFTEMSLQRTFARFVKHPTPENERELLIVDTYSLSKLMPLLLTTTDPALREALSRVASHVTGRQGVIRANMRDDDVRKGLLDWRDFWRRRRADYRSIEGAERLTALVSETRYGRWITRTISGGTGDEAVRNLRARERIVRAIPRTLAMSFAAMLLALAGTAIVLLVRIRRTTRKRAEKMGVELLQVVTLPTLLCAPSEGPLRPILAVVAVAAFLFPICCRTAAHTLDDLALHPATTTARALGASGDRALFRFWWPKWLSLALSLLVPVLPLAVELTFVAELLLALPGAGPLVAAASAAREGARMTSVVLVLAALFMVLHVIVDLAVRALDPPQRGAEFVRNG